MPKAELIKWDFTKGLPQAISGQKFDFIISTYALHHLPDDEKAAFIRQLLDCLEDGGAILIGDVCFLSRKDLLACKTAAGDGWDNDEIYFVMDELSAMTEGQWLMECTGYSSCAGVIIIANAA